MGGFWTRSPSSSYGSTSESLPPSLPPAARYPKEEVDSVSVKPAPAPVKALSTPLPSRWFSISSDRSETEAAIDHQEQPSPTTSTETPQTSSASSHPSPRLEHSPLPNLPFVPSPDQNPSLTGSTPFKADPSSILLSYPRSNVDHVHDFYGLYNPPESKIWGMTSTMVMCAVAAVSKTFMTFGSYTGVHNMNPFLKILHDPYRTRPILTVTNHASTPVGHFFRFGQIVPIIRGNGIYQPAIDKSINLLRSGRWVHIFPEGKINQTPDLIRLKWGVGRILMEYGGPMIQDGGQPMDEVEMPIVIPIYHLGMEDILRLNEDNSSPVFPKLGMPLTIVFGEPIEFGSLMQEYKDGKTSEIETRIKMTERVFEALEELKVAALRLQKEQAARAEEDRIQKGRWWWIQPADTAVKIEEL
ncbi:hypothetical protein BG003_011671 [Podila horticola]|nr:hypothetical protein BG003_011671 [Podila horticola]